MVRRAGAGRGVVHLAGIGLHVGDELGGGVDRHLAGIDRDYLRHQRHHGDRLEVLLEIVVEVLVDRRRDRVVDGADEEDGAVGLHLGSLGGAHRAACPALVVDDDLAAELLTDLRRQWPRKDIGAAAGRKRIDPGDRLRRPALLGIAPRAGAARVAASPSFSALRRVEKVDVIVGFLPKDLTVSIIHRSQHRLLLGTHRCRMRRSRSAAPSRAARAAIMERCSATAWSHLARLRLERNRSACRRALRVR